MTDQIANNSKGSFGEFAKLAAANDAIIWMPLETSGLESDATLLDFDDFAALVAGTTNEQTTLGRKTAASVTRTVDDTNNRVDVDCADLVWTGGTGNAVSRLAGGYDPDTTGGSDSDIILIGTWDFVVTPAGGDITAQFNAAGFARAS